MELNIDRSGFKDEQNKYRTQALFYEYYIDQSHAVFTLADEDREIDGKVYYSLKKLYLEIADPTEYLFAMQVFKSYPHWLRLRKYFLKDRINSWVEELDLKLRAEGIKQNIIAANKGNYNAAKWLADRGWEQQRGRPSKAEKEGKLKQDAALINDVEKDMARIGLVAIK
jgi:hypothetical protein